MISEPFFDIVEGTKQVYYDPQRRITLMCGIVGYTGNDQAAEVLLNGLSKLEYRGYDSAGIAVRDGDSEPVIVKEKGRIADLKKKIGPESSILGTCGIGHTRWATHGAPSETNAHPHHSDDNAVVGVHNGIIENYEEIRKKLKRKGYKFYSETDTECIVKLIDYYYKKYNESPIQAISRAILRVRGSYALCLMFKDFPGEIFCARNGSPMIIGVTGDNAFVASDVPAILNYTRQVYYIDNMEMAHLKPGSVEFFNVDCEPILKELVEIKWDAEAAEKGGYEHFMMKEIHEQPKAVKDTIHSVTDDDNNIDLSGVGLSEEEIKEIQNILIIGCGSAYHVGMVAQYVLEDLANIPVRVELASEFRYRKSPLAPNTLAIIISQSGETADSLEALRKCKANGVKTLGIVNVVGSSIAREADFVFYTLAGPEIAVATTKAYSTQLIANYLLAIEFGRVRGLIKDKKAAAMVAEMKTLPEKIQKILDEKERLQWFASKFANAQDIFFLGRGIDYATCMEGSLKMKEISYIHSEAYAAGELKHGTISLIEDGTLVISVLTQSDIFEKTVSNMVEVKSRGGYLMGLTTAGNYNLEDVANFTVFIPETDEHFSTSLAVVPLQLMGYYVSLARGLDVDKPRNLAKSVTVE